MAKSIKVWTGDSIVTDNITQSLDCHRHLVFVISTVLEKFNFKFPFLLAFIVRSLAFIVAHHAFTCVYRALTFRSSCIHRALGMRSSCAHLAFIMHSVAFIMRSPCIHHALILRLSCVHRALTMRSSCVHLRSSCTHLAFIVHSLALSAPFTLTFHFALTGHSVFTYCLVLLHLFSFGIPKSKNCFLGVIIKWGKKRA